MIITLLAGEDRILLKWIFVNRFHVISYFLYALADRCTPTAWALQNSHLWAWMRYQDTEPKYYYRLLLAALLPPYTDGLWRET